MGMDAVASAPSAGRPLHDGALSCPGFIISPPLALDSQGIYNAGSESKQKNIVFKVLDILKGARPGTDLTAFQVPAQLNLPKSQLQCYGEQVYCCGQNVLEQCTEGATPLDRFLAVVRWHISLIRPVPFGKAPYNPILGETHHVTAGDLNLIVEQVSHHPPVSALYATNSKKKIEILQWNFSQPRFYGNSVAVSVNGRRSLTLSDHGETYETSAPKLNFRFWPGTCSEWIGDTVVKCAETGLEAIVSFKSRPYFSRGKSNQVSGKIFWSSSRQVLYTLSGSWDKTVMLEDKENGKKTVLYDGKEALSTLKNSVVADHQAVSPMESAVVWSKVTKGVFNQDWDLAREAKSGVEEAQRALRKQRSNAGQSWKPKYFSKTANGEWEWTLKGQPVPPGPITW